ncbi:hypothetical protein HPB48_014659 [Haemaphysalis longicornis]|uniref:RNase H type-1 domain-containing protein n=1 Tax=Haemaphysalis longicornis TaxID=44386 RepID=A0A9J6GRR5_HAELO|nr:hypothetical protein HPB48_014659 [Haemaphysalis longicornis]
MPTDQVFVGRSCDKTKVTPRALDIFHRWKLLPFFSRSLQDHPATIGVPVRRRGGPPGPFKSPKHRVASLRLQRRPGTPGMQDSTRPLQPITTDASPFFQPPASHAAAPSPVTLSAMADPASQNLEVASANAAMPAPNALLPFFSRSLQDHPATIGVPVRRRGGPPGPFKSPKHRVASLRLQRRPGTPGMQDSTRPLQPITTDASPFFQPPASHAAAPSPITLSAMADPASQNLEVASANAAMPAPNAVSGADSAGPTAPLRASAFLTADCAAIASPTMTLAAEQVKSPPHPPTASPLDAAAGTGPFIATPSTVCSVTQSLRSAAASYDRQEHSIKPAVPPTEDASAEMDLTQPPGDDARTQFSENAWTTVGTARTPASTAPFRIELITVDIQLPPGTLTTKLPLYDLLTAIASAAQLCSKTSEEITLQAKPTQSLVFLKTYSPLPLTSSYSLSLSLSLTSLHAKTISIKPYARSPPISCLGVIHNTLKPGRLLHCLVQERHLTLLNTPGSPTRAGTTSQRPTTPDLTFSRGPLSVQWRVTAENLLSDHFLIHLSISVSHIPRRRLVTHIDWDAFRTALASHSFESYENWTSGIAAALSSSSRRARIRHPIQDPDPHFLRLWRRRKRLQRSQPQNTELASRIAALRDEIVAHCASLEHSRWSALCDNLDSALHSRSTWSLFKSLLGTKPTLAPTLAKALAQGTASDLFNQLASLYLPPPLTPSYMDYSGEPNSDLDRPFTLRELEAALVGNAKRSAPGQDAITYTALRNLPDNAKEFLLQIFNQAWDSGSLPSSWTSSLITMIPKPGKPPSIANLRPISLTSCVGKTLERMALTRLSEFLEKRDFFPHSLIGFRRRVGAQDMFLLLQHTFLSSTPTQIHALLRMVGDQVGRMVRRVSNKRGCLRSRDALRLANAFVTSRILYSTPYLRLRKCDVLTLEGILRKIYKRALDLPISTSNQRLADLGMTNTYGELKEAYLHNQYLRLTKSHAGRCLLQRLHISYTYQAEERTTIPEDWCGALDNQPPPQNMARGTHEGRRTARVTALQGRYGSRPGVFYTDASGPHHGGWYTAAVIHQNVPVQGLTFRAPDISHAEEVAIALAAADRASRIIITDSRSACQNLTKGRITIRAARILKGCYYMDRPNTRSVIWTPAHAGLGGNEVADASARALDSRDPPRPPSLDDPEPNPVSSFRDIKAMYKLNRLRFPPPAPGLTKADERWLLRLYTNTVLWPAILKHFNPAFSGECPHCDHPFADQSSTWI